MLARILLLPAVSTHWSVMERRWEIRTPAVRDVRGVLTALALGVHRCLVLFDMPLVLAIRLLPEVGDKNLATRFQRVSKTQFAWVGNTRESLFASEAWIGLVNLLNRAKRAGMHLSLPCGLAAVWCYVQGVPADPVCMCLRFPLPRA